MILNKFGNFVFFKLATASKHNIAKMNSVLFQMIVGVFVFLQSANGILVNTSMVLQQILCQDSCSSDSMIYLDSSVHYKLDAGTFCIVDTSCVESISLSSNNDINHAVISCSAERLDNQTTKTGIAFVNSRVVLQKITLIKCGTYLKTLPEPIQSMFNSSVVRYHESYAAALLMVNCTVIITNIVLNSSFGFGLIGINIAQNEFQSLSQNSKTEFNNIHLGSGILLHYIDSTNSLQNYNRTVHLNSLISNHFLTILPPADHTTNYFVCGSALTVIFAQTTFTVKVWVRDSSFHRITSGSLAGAVAIYQYNRHSSVSISSSLFEANVVYFQSLGASITLVLNDLTDNLRTNFDNTSIIPLSISGCTFDNRNVHLLNNASLIYVNVKGNPSSNKLPPVEILIKDTRCVGMHGTKYSGCLYAKAESSNTSIVLEDISVLSNSIGAEWLTGNSGLLVFDSINSVQIVGQSIFNSNYGSVITATDSVVILQGFIEFINNHAGCGAAIHITGKSLIYFAFTANVNFVNNSAVISGGAIYSDTVIDKCPLCFDDLIQYRVAYFINNIAGLSGKDIHSTRLFNCHMCNSNSNPHRSMLDVLTFLLGLRHQDEGNRSLLSLSTKPSTLYWLNRDTIETKVYPGQSIEMHLVALDVFNRSVYSPVQIHLRCTPIQPIHCDRSSWLLFVQREQLLQENQKFTKVTATIHTSNKSINRAIMTEIGCSILELNSFQSVMIFINPCPWGFHLNPTSGICECSPLVKKFNSLKLLNSDDALQPQLCSIVDQQFDSSIMETWAGVIVDENGQKTFAVSNNCPSGNCNIPASEYLSYYTNETGLYRATKQAHSRLEHLPICAAHREGLLCGKCIQGYSVAFNSKKCEICHNRYLVPNILALLLYGPLLIAVLFTFTLTLSSGALNGIIFYANLTNIGLYDLITLPFPHNKPLQICISIATTFLEILNANPVFPVCLFDGMNEMHKIIIKLLFQFYIWMIVLILMCVSRYSVWLTRSLGNSSIKVLMTVFHISVCRMLLTLIDVFSCTHVYSENGKTLEVWLVDGSITCYQSYHLVLSACTLFVIGPLILVYCTVLLFPSQIYKCRFGIKYCRPLIEAVLAPYRRGKEYWFTLRIAILVVLYSVYVSYRGTNYLLIFYITLPILTILTMAQIYSQPFNSKLINLLDMTTAMNFTILVMLTWYFMLHEIVYTVVVMCVISVFINIFFLCLIILYRVAVILNRFSMIRKCVVHSAAATKYISFKWKRSNISAADLVDVTDSFHQPCADYREPLLRSSDN